MLALGSIFLKHSASTCCHSLFFSLLFSPPCPAMPFALSLQHQGPQHVSADECAWGHFQSCCVSAFNYWLRFEVLFSVFCFLCNVSLWMFVSLLQRAVKMQNQAGCRIWTWRSRYAKRQIAGLFMKFSAQKSKGFLRKRPQSSKYAKFNTMTFWGTSWKSCIFRLSFSFCNWRNCLDFITSFISITPRIVQA